MDIRKELEFVADRLEAWADSARIKVMRLPDSKAEPHQNLLANYNDLSRRLRWALEQLPR